MSHEEPTMPDEEPAMTHEEPTIDDTPTQGTAVTTGHTTVQPADVPSYDPGEERWPEDSEALELPRRPRRRLLTPIPLTLLGVLLIACGFIGGVLVEKGQGPSTPATGSGASLASRFAALRGGTTGAAGASARSGSATTGGGFGGLSGAGGGFTRPTAGSVAYLAGSTLYVTNAEGNTVKVTTSPATSVSRTVKSTVKAIHPGETVTVTGATGSSGAVSAESISVGSSGGGLAALFGTSAARAGLGGGGARGGSAGGEPALFGG
jgi:hypothetical protein